MLCSALGVQRASLHSKALLVKTLLLRPHRCRQHPSFYRSAIDSNLQGFYFALLLLYKIERKFCLNFSLILIHFSGGDFKERNHAFWFDEVSYGILLWNSISIIFHSCWKNLFFTENLKLNKNELVDKIMIFIFFNHYVTTVFFQKYWDKLGWNILDGQVWIKHNQFLQFTINLERMNCLKKISENIFRFGCRCSWNNSY